MKGPGSISEQQAVFRDSLRAVPVRNERARVRKAADDSSVYEIEVDLVYGNAVLRFFRGLLGASNVKRYRLDRIGSAVYESIDGVKSCEELADEFAAREKISFFESRALLGQYFKTLTERGIIGAKIPR